MWLKPRNAPVIRASLSPTAKMAVLTSLKVTKSKQLRNWPLLALFQFLSRLSQTSNTIPEVSTAIKTVELPPRMLTTQFWPQATETRKELISGT